MSKPKTITIDDVEYVRKDSVVTPELTGDIQIVVADRSWNFIGHTSRDKEGNLVIANARVIRRWGTKSGLGQLAREGRQKDTILDEAGTVTLPAHAVIALFDVVKEKWS